MSRADLCEPGDAIVWPSAVDKRIAWLRSQCRLAGGPGLADWEADQLALLYRFRREVRLKVPYRPGVPWDTHPGFISDGYFSSWAENEAEDLYGREAVQSAYFDLDSYEDDRRAEMTEVDFGGTTYYG